jgi:hypothetical protein
MKDEKYILRADTKSYSEWSVDSEGKLLYLEHDFEGYDFLNYKILDKNLDTVFEGEDFEETKRELNRLNKQKNRLI